MQAVTPRTKERTAAAGGRRSLARPAVPVPAGPSPSIDDLVGHWWRALEAAESAVRAAGLYLSGAEAAERTRLLREERAESMQLLGELARDSHSESRLLRLLGTAAPRRAMLGLPEHLAACIFELDGVLATSAAVHAGAWADTFDPFLLERGERNARPFVPFQREHDYEEHVAGIPRVDGVRAFLASRGISLPDGARADAPGTLTVHGLANRKNEALQRRLARGGVDAFAGARSYLVAAQILGMRRPSSPRAPNTEAILERAELADLVDEVVDGRVIEAEHLRPRPAPDSLLAACRRLGVTPHQAASFETTPAGTAAARAAEVSLAVAVGPEAVFAAEADVVVRDLADLLDRSFG